MARTAVVAVFALVVTAVSVRAGDLARPEGQVILRVSGAIANTNAAEAAEFDLAMLRRLDASVVRTSTPWTEGVIEFRGGLVLIAYAANGRPMPVREKGPLRIVYPFETMASLRELHYARAIWQLKALHVR